MTSRIAAASAWCWVLMCLLAFSVPAHAGSLELARHPLAKAVAGGDCEQAIGLIHLSVGDNDGPTAFLAGRMLDEGLCVHRDPQQAAYFFARAADLGLRVAVLDYAAKVGLGVGAPQDFQRAGELCRAAGLDAQNELSTPALGYACTVSGIAGRVLRERVPSGAFVPVIGATVNVRFVPGSGALQIVSVPGIARDLTIGSYLARPIIDANREIGTAWTEALHTVPTPPVAQSETHAVVLPIDVDMTLEKVRGQSSAVRTQFLQGEIHVTHP
jgi:hypothetical protein